MIETIMWHGGTGTGDEWDWIGPSIAVSPVESNKPKQQKQGAKNMEKKGTVVMFREEKGFGFIKCEDNGEDVFVHHSSINMDGFRKLERGQTVAFDVKQTPKGLEAVGVSIIDEA